MAPLATRRTLFDIFLELGDGRLSGFQFPALRPLQVQQGKCSSFGHTQCGRVAQSWTKEKRLGEKAIKNCMVQVVWVALGPSLKGRKEKITNRTQGGIFSCSKAPVGLQKGALAIGWERKCRKPSGCAFSLPTLGTSVKFCPPGKED